MEELDVDKLQRDLAELQEEQQKVKEGDASRSRRLCSQSLHLMAASLPSLHTIARPSTTL